MIHTLTLNPSLDMRMRYLSPRLGELNRAESVLLEPSGKGLNVARALHAQGHLVRAVLPLGGHFGRIIAESLTGFAASVIPIAGQTRCNVKVTDVQSGAVSEFNAPGPRLSAEEWAEVQAVLLEPVRPGDWAVLSGSLPPGLGHDTYALLATRLKARGALVCVDAEGEQLRQAIAAKPFLVKPNRKELEGLMGRELSSLDQLVSAARAIQQVGAEHVAVSLGGEGALYLLGDEVVRAAAPEIQVYQTMGCGDALMAGTVAGLIHGLPTLEVARQGVAWGTARALVRHTEFPSPQETGEVLGRVEVRLLE
ncbi:MAG: 1-phosphofructokinase family hexose kinase [Meiothermus sp.]|nr:1-phosphofructokinase family hexose kinase [Meiothermus sp.]